MGNIFDIYSSKVKRINIPIPGFKFFHKASSKEEVDPKFIGREQITDKLYSWLKDDHIGGSYLVTGFRGMGKSSFVGRVLNELTQKTTGLWYVLVFLLVFLFFLSAFSVYYFCNEISVFFIFIFFDIIIGACIFNISRIENTCNRRKFVHKLKKEARSLRKVNHKNKFKDKFKKLGWIFAWRVLRRTFNNFTNKFRDKVKRLGWKFAYRVLRHSFNNFINKFKEKIENLGQKFVNRVLCRDNNNFNNRFKDKVKKLDWKRACRVLYNNYNKNKSYKRICVNVNLGQEVLNEHEVLSLISHQLYNKYREYVLSPIANFDHWSTYILSPLVISCILILYIGDSSRIIAPYEWEWCIILCDFINNNVLFCIKVIIPLFLFIVIYIVSQCFSSSQINILSRLRLLNQRLDAQVTFDEHYDSKVDYGPTEWNAGFKKKRFYGVATVREIEQELIDVMDSISKGISKPSIVFILDELDKVDSNSISVPAGDVKTEFSNEKNFPGGGTTRRRKQNVLHLLANMKLFVSTAKAKFIFISGRELYDAYLADLSDREFAVSSIFSGVIYVDSFCINEHKEKDVMSNVETYICKQLIPHNYIKKQFIRYYAMELVHGPAFERFDINLKLYYQYLVDVYKDNLGESFLKPFKEKIYLYYNAEEINSFLYRSYIDKAVNLLYHFSVYLYHISNGSPKKMMLYFEKHVKKCVDEGKRFKKIQADDISNPNPDGDIFILAKGAPKYYLSFGYTDQRKIGFIHYLSYPVNQILVNANQYSDKLLVSVSFLVDHIYKFHNGGFSWRNLEYTPELLEVYKIPGFRSFINSIISYLQQTHLIAITCGLFQFKFRKQIAEEISLASRFSEEIAALFNFTLDESLNVKQHYTEIRNAYLELEGKGDELTPKHTPRLSIGLHNIMGDLYMFDEEFNNAIFEYHAAVKEMEKEMEMEQKKGVFPDLKNTLYSIQLMLKLGLANEKRNTNESALTVYSELVAKLIDFRHFDEKELQLTYRLQKNFDWPSYKGILVPKKYDSLWNREFNEIHPRIVYESDNLIHHSSMPFMASGQNLSTAFAHLLTPEKYSVMQRLSLFQDSRLIYQSLLAKLFVKEKIDMGGITMTDIEMIESEYNFLNLATNTSEKFLSSSDFFRRLGDIMFYKNGLTITAPDDNRENNGDYSFMNGLYYWGYDIKRELLDFCNAYNCYEHYEMLLSAIKKIKNNEFETNESIDKVLLIYYSKEIPDINEKCKGILKKFCNNKEHVKMLELIPTKEVIACNKHRQKMIRCNRPVPCLACNYYSRSMRILMRGMFDCEILEKRIGKSCSVFIIMEKLLVKGTSRSLRQDYVIQLGEILDCRANVLLSCATEEANVISPYFLEDFLLFIETIENICPDDSFNKEIKKEIGKLDKKYGKKISKLEECILYYWEASKCFYIANDLMKASASLKKILRIFQNYLKTSSCIENNKREKRIELVFNNIDQIKEAFVKPCLIYLYSHYNNINFAEIQKLKWIFSVQTYEDIPLNRLSLFPDVEQILLLYYDLLRRCVVIDNSLVAIDEKYNDVFNNRQKLLSKVYRNTTLSSLRQDSTIYERVMALRFKVLMNSEFLFRLGLTKDLYYQTEHEKGFVEFFLNYINSDKELSELLGQYKYCFRFALNNITIRTLDEKGLKSERIGCKLHLLEFLIKDSLFCLTRILEIITPQISSTLFSNSFYGEIYQMVYEWYMLFDELFMTYRYLEKDDIKRIGNNPKWRTYYKLINEFDSIKEERINMVKKYIVEMKDKEKIYYYERFYNETTHEIGKAQANYTFAKYSLAMAKESYERALQMHHEGKAYKDMISQMYYLDDDLKNDTIQFSTAIERYKINNGYIQAQLDNIQEIMRVAPMHEIENYAREEMTKMDLKDRFY